MYIIAYSILLSLAIELLTTVLRVVFHKQSVIQQKKLHIPRIHHAYPGIAAVLPNYLYIHSDMILIVGIALILSDVLHHFVVLPYLKRNKYDIRMVHHSKLHHAILRTLSSSCMILVGATVIVTQLAVGTALIIAGIMLFIFGIGVASKT